MRVYDQKQLDRQRLIEERKEALYQSVPRLAEIDRQIVHLNIQKAKNLGSRSRRTAERKGINTIFQENWIFREKTHSICFLFGVIAIKSV